MDEVEYLLLANQKQPLDEIVGGIISDCSDRGIDYWGPRPLAARREEVLTVHEGNDPEDKKNNWLTRVDPENLQYFIAQEKGRLHGRYFKLTPREGINVKDLLEDRDIPEQIQIQVTVVTTSSPENENAPFSYDPSQEYVTEP